MVVMNLNDIAVDQSVQLESRGLDESTVRNYIEAIESGATFEPVVVFEEGLILGDGFHRAAAFRFLGREDVPVEIKSGGLTEAKVYAATANRKHGRPMTQAQKREAAERLYTLTSMSQEAIAKEVGVSNATISRWFSSLTNVRDREVTAVRNGTAYTQNTANIGKTEPAPQRTFPDPIVEDPPLDSADLTEPDSAAQETALEATEDVAKEQIEESRPMKPKASREGGLYEPKGYDLCQTPPYALDPLIPYLDGVSTVWEPAQGEGYLVEAFYDAGFEVIGSDIQRGENFFYFEPSDPYDAIVTNPPYTVKYDWLKRCYDLGKPFALLMPVEMLGAVTAQDVIKEMGINVLLLNKRVNFKMPNKGWEGSAQFPVAWFTWGLKVPESHCTLTFGQIDPKK